MIKKMMVVATLAGAIGLGTGMPAFAASSQTSFNGLSHKGYPVEFSAVGQSDGTGTGTFVYQPVVNHEPLTIQCTDFNRYVATHTNNPPPDGYPKSIANSTNCFSRGDNGTQGGTRYYAHIESIDRIGIGLGPNVVGSLQDSICITIKLFPGRKHPDPLIKDCGAPQGGDVVITPT